MQQQSGRDIRLGEQGLLHKRHGRFRDVRLAQALVSVQLRETSLYVSRASRTARSGSNDSRLCCSRLLL